MEAAKLAATVTFSDKLKQKHGFSFWDKAGENAEKDENEEVRSTSDEE
jgi:hypothetical protein